MILQLGRNVADANQPEVVALDENPIAAPQPEEDVQADPAVRTSRQQHLVLQRVHKTPFRRDRRRQRARKSADEAEEVQQTVGQVVDEGGGRVRPARHLAEERECPARRYFFYLIGLLFGFSFFRAAIPYPTYDPTESVVDLPRVPGEAQQEGGVQVRAVPEGDRTVERQDTGAHHRARGDADQAGDPEGG